MKYLLLCSLFLFAFNATAQEPIFAKLQMEGVSDNMLDVNPRFALVNSGELMIDSSIIALTLSKQMPECPEGMYCPQIMPSSVVLFLNLIDIVHTECSTKYIAESPNDSGNQIYERLVVEDFSNSTCERIIRATGIITYTATQSNNTAAARFFVQGGFQRN